MKEQLKEIIGLFYDLQQTKNIGFQILDEKTFDIAYFSGNKCTEVITFDINEKGLNDCILYLKSQL